VKDSNPKNNIVFSLFGKINFWAIFSLFIFSVILTLAPTVRFRSWNVDYRWFHWIGFVFWCGGYIFWTYSLKKSLNRIDPVLIAVIGLFSGLGILTIWRLRPTFGFRQTAWFLVSIFVSLLMVRNRKQLGKLRKYKYLLLFAGIILVGLTFFIGTYPGGEGPKLWLGGRGIYFQPSELLKIFLIIYISAYFSDKNIHQIKIPNLISPTLLLLSISLFILLGQRDLGTSLIFIVIYVFMLFFIFDKKRILLIGFISMVIIGALSYFFIDLVRIRMEGWIAPWLDPQAGSYQIIQSTIAIASGGLFGSGIGIGRPNLVPISHSDFIYSAIVEENGLIGGFVIILLLSILLFRGLGIANKAESRFSKYLVFGIIVYLLSQSILIIGGNTRLLPITGVTLPFVSYGGSSLLISFIAFSFILIIDRQDMKFQPNPSISLKMSVSLMAAGLILVSLTTGWWAIIRSDDLQQRDDNPRYLISSQFVERGEILGQKGNIIASTEGEIGSFHREIKYPPLSNTIGYVDRRHGINGLENTFDDYLSGFRGYPASNLWLNYLLYDHPPPGRDIRLTIELRIQQIVDEFIGNHRGSAVVINPETGSILAIASHPFFNANELSENFYDWQESEQGHFLNRAVQGAYPIGDLINPFALSYIDDEQFNSFEFDFLESRNSIEQNCMFQSEQEINTLKDAVSNGCQFITERIADQFGTEIFIKAYDNFSLGITPDIGLPAFEQGLNHSNAELDDILEGSNPLRASPLGAAYAMSAFSSSGLAPALEILSAVDTYGQGWIFIDDPSQQRIISEKSADAIANLLESQEIAGWEITARGSDSNGTVVWYVAGSRPNWDGTPFVLVLVLEVDDPESANRIGRQIITKILSN